MIAKMIFTDDGDQVVVGIENAMADKPTPAQEAVLKLFAKFKDEVRDNIEVVSG